MRILVLNQFFWPDSAATSQMLTDTARQCARLDWEVTALCGANGYAPSNTEVKPDVHIVRTSNFGFGRTSKTRIASYLSYLSGALWHGLRLRKSGTILTLTTPPLLSVVGSILKTLRGSRHYIWEMDVYPDIAVALRVLRRGGFLSSVAHRLAHWSRGRADGIIVLGEDMRDRLVSHGIPADKIHVCENWADGREITPILFPEGPLCIYYSGNLGLAHDVETIREAMTALRDDSRFRFIFAGAGPLRGELERFCSTTKMGSVTFQPYCLREELGRSLGEGHLGLVTQRPESLGSIVPSKTYGIMAAGRPVLYIGPRGATPARIIERYGCGWHIEPGDVRGLIELLLKVESRRELIYEAGARARRAFELNYDRPLGVARVCAVLRVSPVVAHS